MLTERHYFITRSLYK